MSTVTDDVAAATDFFFQVAAGVPVEQAAASCIGVNRARMLALRGLLGKGEEALRWLEPLVTEPSRKPVEPAERPPPSGAQLPLPTGETASPERSVRTLLEGLPNYRDLRHIASDLERRVEPEAVPRAGSRGNALLWVLHQFGRAEGLTTEDLAYGFYRMGIFPDDDVDAQRKVSWELSELKRKGWPVERGDGKRWRLRLPGRGK